MNPRTALVACVLAAVGAGADANLIVNGGFSTFVPTAGTGGGWTATGVLAGWGWFPAGGHPGAYYVLNNNGASGTDPELSQTLTGLVIGERYRVSGDYTHYAHNDSPANAVSFAVEIDSTTIFTAPTTPGTIATGGTWQSFGADFIATAASMTLHLRGEVDPTDNDVALDNIRVESACHLVNDGFTDPVPTNGTGNGWTSAGSATGDGWTASGGASGAYFFLNSNGGGDPEIAQTLTLTIGKCYTVTGDYASIVRNMTPPNAPSLAVDLNGVQVYTLLPTVPLPSEGGSWATFWFNFHATVATNTLRLRSEINGTDNDFGVDNLCIMEICCECCPGDANCDGLVTFADITVVLANFGGICP